MLPVLAVVLAALCFSTTGTAQALASVDASPLAVGAARILVGGGILGVAALVFRTRGRAVADAVPARARRGSTGLIVAMGALGVLAYQPAFFLGTRANGVAIGTVVALGSAPIITGALEAVLRRRAPGLRWAVATAIALTGVVLVSGLVAGGAPHSSVDPVGVLASVGAGASYALYAVASKLLLDRSWAPHAAMGAIFGSAAVLSVPLLLVGGTAWLATPDGVALALWLGVVTTAVGYLLFAWGLRSLRATTVATLTLAEPLSATLLGIVLLHEQLSAMSVAGLVAIAGGLVVLGAGRRRPGDVAAPA
ncbi:DMT family transporter [Microbacterium sp.]|uniref:DMT family transporter n=1 Tax=Microbacterium sp. TaxID=51671 RepID=UPI0039E24C56